MKKFTVVLACIALLTIAGCGKNQPIDDTIVTTTQITEPTEVTTQPQTEAPEINNYVPDQVPMAAISMPVSERKDYTEDDVLLFSYKSQTISLIIPDTEIERKVILDIQNRLDGFNTEAEDISLRARSDYNGSENWNNYFYNVLYTPGRIDLSVLSLHGVNTTWVGGAHPNRSCTSANYDLTTGDVLTLGSILTHEDSLATLCQLLIDEATEIKAEKYLYTDYEDTIRNRFAQNESYNESWYFSNEGLCFYFSPYEIAPYFAGIITLTIPYENLTGIIEDRYFPAERDTSTGTLRAVKQDDADLDAFTQIAEVLLDSEGQMVFLFTDTSVQDLTIEVGTIQGGKDFVQEASIFAAPILTPGDAVMLQSTFEDSYSIRITYRSGDKVIQQLLSCNSSGILELNSI